MNLEQYYRDAYLPRLCQQNVDLFDTDYHWNFQPEDLPLDPRKALPHCHRTFLEIGFGHGEVLEELVPRFPDTGFVAIERRPARVRKCLKRMNRVGEDRVKLIRVNLELLREKLFVPGAFDEILINHPDPWPKTRHGHHRFFQRDAMDWLADILIKGGVIEVASDHTEYFFSILHLFETDDRFESLLPPPFYLNDPIPGRPASRFEMHNRRAGVTVRLLRFSRK